MKSGRAGGKSFAAVVEALPLPRAQAVAVRRIAGGCMCGRAGARARVRAGGRARGGARGKRPSAGPECAHFWEGGATEAGMKGRGVRVTCVYAPIREPVEGGRGVL